MYGKTAPQQIPGGHKIVKSKNGENFQLYSKEPPNPLKILVLDGSLHLLRHCFVAPGEIFIAFCR